MKTVTIRCEHTTTETRLQVSGDKICFIQCGLVQIALSDAQAGQVRSHCQCMESNLHLEDRTSLGEITMTIDPSQLDLGGEPITACPIG
jgi:hypothetical protein